MIEAGITVLIPTELQERSESVQRAAFLLCRRLAANAVLLHVVTDAYQDAMRQPAFTQLSPVEPHQEYLAKQRLKRIEVFFHDNGVACISSVRSGDPASHILAKSRELPADFIVMGSKRRTVASGILGGTVERVLTGALCPVIVVPHGTETHSLSVVHERPTLNETGGIES